MYESVIDIEAGNTVTHLVSVAYTLATEEAERIGVDHVARVSDLESGTCSSGNVDDMAPSIVNFFLKYFLILRIATVVFSLFWVRSSPRFLDT